MGRVTIKKRISLREGESGKFFVEPMPSHFCRVVIELKLDGSNDWEVMSGADISGSSVPSPSNVGEFHQTGHSQGRLSLRADGDDASGTLRITVICEDKDLNEKDFSIVEEIGTTPTPTGSKPPDWSDLFFGGWKKIWDRLLSGTISDVMLALTLSLFTIITAPYAVLRHLFVWFWNKIKSLSK